MTGPPLQINFLLSVLLLAHTQKNAMNKRGKRKRVNKTGTEPSAGIHSFLVNAVMHECCLLRAFHGTARTLLGAFTCDKSWLIMKEGRKETSYKLRLRKHNHRDKQNFGQQKNLKGFPRTRGKVSKVLYLFAGYIRVLNALLRPNIEAKPRHGQVASSFLLI